MNQKILTFISSRKISNSHNIELLTKSASLELLELLNLESIKVDGFDGFHLFSDGKYQIDQIYCRDYSNFDMNESYLLCKEYFLKAQEDNIYYDLSFFKPTRNGLDCFKAQ